MADVNLVKSKYTDSDVTSLGELAAADNAKIPGTLQVVGATTLDTDLTVANGGTGASTLTDHGVLVGSGTDAVTALTAGTNGQVLVGSTGADPVFATITDGEGIDTTLGAGTLTIACEDASTSNKGVIEIATTTEDVTGTSPSLASTPAGVAAATAILKNPLAFAQGVYTTYGTGASIQVQSNSDINMGINNFTIGVRVLLPNWIPGSIVYLLSKDNGSNGVLFYVSSTGYLAIYFRSGAVTKTSTVPLSLTNNTFHTLLASITRETASTAGSVVFYVDGYQFGDSIPITAGVPATVSNASPLYIMGNYLGTARYKGITKNVYIINRALTAAEVLDLYRNGINFADKWGSQTSIITGNDSTFAGASNWANVDINAYDETGDLTITASAAGQYCTLPVANATTVAGKKYRLDYDVANLVSTWTIKDFSGTQTIGTISASGTGQSVEFTASTTGGLRIVAVGDTSSADIDNVYLYAIGATLALEPEGIQPNPGQWLDSSSNKLHAWQPATGSSLTRYKKTFEIRGINTWAGTHEAQSVTMLTDASRAMLPTDCYITEIIGVITGTTIEDIIVGDGSDTDHWVAATTGLSTGTVSFTIANHTSDGTNMEMVVDPDANFTGSIEWTIRGFIID